MYLPVVTRFFCPPDTPLLISSPTMVSAQISSPRTYIFMMKTFKQVTLVIILEKNSLLVYRVIHNNDTFR